MGVTALVAMPAYSGHQRTGRARTPAEGWSTIMGFLMSDAMPLDALLGTTTWMQQGLTDWAYEADAARDLSEYEAEDSAE